MYLLSKGGYIYMSSYTISGEPFDEAAFRRFYTYAKSLTNLTSSTDLDYIFEIALKNTDRFPGINITGNQTPQIYLERWVKGYYEANNNRPSSRTASPKSACTDPAIAVIVKNTQGMSEEEAKTGESNHNLFMSAENIQGNLLEEYIAGKIRPYGFLWCEGNVLRAIDFCNTNGSLLLQIKNKSNTENSSSSNIREGTTIEKWYRLGTKTQNGKKIPDYKWKELNDYINTYKTEGSNLPPCSMSEEDYEDFLTKVSSLNTGLITNK